jgi:hypothetical protein
MMLILNVTINQSPVMNCMHRRETSGGGVDAILVAAEGGRREGGEAYGEFNQSSVIDLW